MQRYCSSILNQKLSVFRSKLTDQLLRRFLALLHPFRVRARKPPPFYFCQEFCLVQILIDPSHHVDEDFSRLIAVGGGMFERIMTLGGLTLS